MTSPVLLLTPPALAASGATATNTTRPAPYREELIESYDSPEEFACASRRLAEQGWMIARVSERRVPRSALARLLKPLASHLEVSYERLVRQPTGVLDA